MDFPLLQIRQQYARIGIDADLGTFDIKQPKPEMHMKSTPGKSEIRQPQGELTIDSSRAKDALAIGSHTQFMKRVYNEAYQVGLQSIGTTIEEGNRMAAIHTKANVIADLAVEGFFKDFKMAYETEASISNVDLQYTANKPQIHIEKSQMEFDPQLHKPEIFYNRGKLDIYLAQRATLEFIPPQIDVKL
ncbi:DUF6470 family protein [Paenibacillus eucommiae]|uniref:Uncharacterized protein n=1 Tax=Paenibacillus eucommiae TaxID=1355755 RepID=A0ABS4IYI3_9BACL|nr:DUF6470 family protein [Paenibacillus eucommiae]MBP1992642.1 hypothetical protein [Paenibacillus eucommiae]